jgi:type IV secretory pathway VirB10-like protein
MEISKAAVGFLIGACVTAGAGGAYLATRDAAPVALASQQETALAATNPPAGAVEHSEAVLPEAPEAAPVARTAPAPRVAAAPRATVRQDPPARPEVSDRAPRAAAPPPAAPPVVEEAIAPLPLEPPRISDNQASRTVEPAGPVYDELVVAADSVVGLEIETAISSDRARVEDQVVARVTRDVKVGDRVAIPAGSRAQGEVTVVERGGRLRERARLGVRFTSIVLADGTRVPIETETIFREGDAPGGESAAKIGGGAIGGAIIGGILGGAKGAAIGGAVGAGGGTAAVLAGGRNAATLPAGTPVTVRVEDPVVVTVER